MSTAPHTDQVITTIAEIADRLDWMRRRTADAQGRYDRAASVGAKLADEVRRYVADPGGVGLDALRAAYSRFGSEHAGNFSQGVPTEADRVIEFNAVMASGLSDHEAREMAWPGV